METLQQNSMILISALILTCLVLVILLIFTNRNNRRLKRVDNTNEVFKKNLQIQLDLTENSKRTLVENVKNLTNRYENLLVICNKLHIILNGELAAKNGFVYSNFTVSRSKGIEITYKLNGAKAIKKGELGNIVNGEAFISQQDLLKQFETLITSSASNILDDSTFILSHKETEKEYLY